MINNGYLIPANAKKSMLIFGLFTPMDLIIFGCGIGATLIMLLVLPVEQLAVAAIALAPALITGFLVFLNTRQKFIWKGWCCKDGESESK